MDSTGELNTCKKRKLNSLLKTDTYPSPSKAIHSLKSDLSDKTKINIANKNTSKKSYSKIKDNELIKSNNSKTTESKISKNLKQTKVP